MKPWIAVAACCLMAASLPAKPQMTSQINLPSLGARLAPANSLRLMSGRSASNPWRRSGRALITSMIRIFMSI